MEQSSISKQIVLQVLQNAAIYLVSFAMLLYGIGKPLQFSSDGLLHKTVSDLTGMELMWVFYGYSKPFILILGFLEISGALLLLFNRTKIIGCFLLSAVLVNVILQDIFYGVNQGALIAAIIYQFLIFFILACNAKKLSIALQAIMAKPIILKSQKKKILIFIYSLTLFFCLKIFEYFITH
ncbi:MAG: hypothetical protein ABIP30_01095 [Ferruginibacter sp.]